MKNREQWAACREQGKIRKTLRGLILAVLIMEGLTPIPGSSKNG